VRARVRVCVCVCVVCVCVCARAPIWSRLCHGMCFRSRGK